MGLRPEVKDPDLGWSLLRVGAGLEGGGVRTGRGLSSSMRSSSSEKSISASVDFFGVIV